MTFSPMFTFLIGLLIGILIFPIIKFSTNLL